MKIGVLATAKRDSGGVFQYTHSLLEALCFYSKYKDDLIIIRDPESDFTFFSDLISGICLRKTSSNIQNKILRILYVNIPYIRKNINVCKNEIEFKDSVDLLISPVSSLLPLYLNKPYIITIHDLQHKYYPQFFSIKERLLRDYSYLKAAQNSVLVICESKYVSADLTKYFGISENKIKVIPSPPPSYLFKFRIHENHLEIVKKKYGLPERFLFYPAHFWHHKNHINLIKALKIIKEKYKQKISLILTGSKNNSFKDVMDNIVEMNMASEIKHLGYIEDEDMPCLYKLSVALVLPTLFESVSLPIWEAFHLNVPVISSDVCALPEQVGNAGLLFDPNSIEDMADKINKVWSDDKLRNYLSMKARERIKDMSLSHYAKQWEKVIEEI